MNTESTPKVEQFYGQNKHLWDQLKSETELYQCYADLFRDWKKLMMASQVILDDVLPDYAQTSDRATITETRHIARHFVTKALCGMETSQKKIGALQRQLEAFDKALNS